MLPQRLPGPVAPHALPVVAQRWRRVLPWLWAATMVQVGLVVAAGAVLLPEQPLLVVVAVVAAAAVWVWERAARIVLRPDDWVLAQSVAALPAGAAIGFGLAARLPAVPPGVPVAGGALGAAVLVGWLHVRAGRPLRSEQVAELWGSPFVLRREGAGPRRTGAGAHRVQVTLGTTELVVQSPLGATAQRYTTDRVRLSSIRSVGVHGPDPVTGAHALQVRTDARTITVPVEDAEELAVALRSRVAAVTPDPPPSQGQPPEAQPDLHLDGPVPLRRSTAPELPPGAPVATVDPPAPAPHGPPVGLVTGVALGLFGVLVLPAVVLATGLSSGSAHPQLLAGAAWLAGVWAVGFRLRHRPRTWSAIALLAGATAAVTVLVARTPSGGSPWAVVGPGAVAVLGALVGGRAAQRLHPAHGRTRLAVRLRLTGATRLLIVEDAALVLRPRYVRPSAAPAVRTPLHGLRLLQGGEVRTGGVATRWPLPDGDALPLHDGSALRVVCGPQQWVLQGPDTSALLTVLHARALRAGTSGARAPQLATLLPPAAAPDGTVELPRWVAVLDELGRQVVFLRSSVAAGLGVLLTWAGGLGLTLAATSSGGAHDVGGGVLALVVGLALLELWRRRARAWRRREDAARDQSWGEQRPDRAPLPGWLPWGARR